MVKIRLKIVLFTVFLSYVAFLASCERSDVNKLKTTRDTEIQLQCFEYGWKGSRASNDSGEHTGFSEGDRMEMLIAGNKKTGTLRMEYKNNRWNPALKRGDYGEGRLVLSAVSPVQTPNRDNPSLRDIDMREDQRSPDNYSISDVLFANREISGDDSSVSLWFRHAMHRLNINLEGSVPDDLVIEVKSLSKGSISLENGVVTADASQGYVWMKPHRNHDGTYSIIIIPQETKVFGNGEGLIRMTSGGKSVSYIFNDSKVKKFDAGMQTTINLTLKTGGGVTVDKDFANRTYWVYGVTGPDFPGRENLIAKQPWEHDVDEGIWFRYSYEKWTPPLLFESQYLTWKKSFGWFDCNKSFKYQGDGKMCWAATASNLIHWWMVQNKKYIEAYDKKFGPEYENMKRPEKYGKMTKDNQQHSEVFNFFKSAFNNQGSWETGGVNWFINGNKSKLSYCKLQNFHGFFSKVFSRKDTIAKDTYNMTKENFNLWIKDAFLHNRAIGFSVAGFAGPQTGPHAMVIWGAEFDAEGNVAFIYFCDNNFGENEPNHASISRFKVVYGKSTIPELKGTYTFLSQLDNTDGTPSKTRLPFSSVTQVDLRLDLWQKAFPEVK